MASAPLEAWWATSGGEVDVGEDVAGDHDEALVELVTGVADRSRRAQGRLLGGVDHADAELRPVPEVAADGIGHERHGDHDVLEAVLAQEVDDVLHHGPVGHGQHGLGLVRGERTKSRALAARHDHRLHASTGSDLATLPRRHAISARPRARARRDSGMYAAAAIQAKVKAGTSR